MIHAWIHHTFCVIGFEQLYIIVVCMRALAAVVRDCCSLLETHPGSHPEIHPESQPDIHPESHPESGRACRFVTVGLYLIVPHRACRSSA